MQLIDGTRFFKKMKKSLNYKRYELTDAHITRLTEIYSNFRDREREKVPMNGGFEKRIVSRIFENRDFGFLKVTAERPLRLNFEATRERIARLDEQTAFANLAVSKKRKDAKAMAVEEEAGRVQQDAIRAILKKLAGKGRYMDREHFESDLDAVAKRAELKLPTPMKKAILAALGERDSKAEICRDAKGHPEPDSELRDTENIPLPRGTALPLPMGFGPDQPNDELVRAMRTAIRVGTVSQSVVVEANAIAVQSDSSDISQTVTAKPHSTSSPAQKPLFTPRLRKYFPETFLWKPEVITDKRGQAHIEFPMADNITAWSMSVVASTESGQVGVARKELRTFQPFFVEHNPPKVLTQGDQISLPVVLRNYSDKPQVLLTDLTPESWFSMLSPAQQRVTVDAGADARAVFTFKADARVNAGKQRVSARNAETGDSVEREVQVHPDGQEVSFTSGKILAGESRVIEVQIPHTAIPDSIDAELRIYPNLLAHVLDAMEGIGKKPAGCAEQVASTGYVSLQALKLLKNAGIENAVPEDPRSQILAKARKSVQDAYSLLPSLQQPNGGFGYWSNTSADAALTAYVLRFLSAAGEFIEVDTGVTAKARGYLVSQQTQAGAWTRYDWSTKDQKDDPIQTAYIARALATSSEVLTGKGRTVVDASVTRALSYLDERISEWNDPYLVGNYAIAAVALKHEAQIANARELLSRLAHDEGPATYWNLEANTTPFYGWGRAGRMETTALAVEALARLQTQHQSAVEGEQINRGLQYLLTHKDRYCTWFSTQATQNVLEAMIMAMPPAKSGPGENSATVLVNGAKLASIGLPKVTEIVGPKVIQFGKELSRGSNSIEVQRVGDTGAMQASVITSYYVPWKQSQATQDENFKAGETRALNLKVKFDRHEAKVGEALTCRVEAERIGFASYGMMVAEIGLPPGAEVEHELLEKARQSSVDGYEVQPDRVVFYLWPTAGGSKFEFTFRPRFAINASSAPSSLYDYYNPDANAVVMPARFTVR